MKQFFALQTLFCLFKYLCPEVPLWVVLLPLEFVMACCVLTFILCLVALS